MAGVMARDAEAPMDEYLFAAGGQDERHRADQIIADFATAFSLEMDFESDRESEKTGKWPVGWTIGFAVAASGLLWALLSALIYFF
jgi:hypothetical protein